MPFATQVSFDASARARFGQRTIFGSHNLPEHPMFTDEALIALLDRFPRNQIYAMHMGHDPEAFHENWMALHDHLSGAELLEAVKRGRLWLNIVRMHDVDKEYRDLVAELYRLSKAQLPSLETDALRITLLLSSPGALVYYHVDAAPSLLWHVRGEKRVWIYPAQDERLLPTELLEDVFAGVAHEYVPYQKSYDRFAEEVVLSPGQVVSWPHNSPHRVTNLDNLNVSLVTEHYTQASRRRARLYCANRFLRKELHVPVRSLKETGVRALTKAVLHKTLARVGVDRRTIKEHVPAFRVDLQAEKDCVVPLNPS